ncbi:TetR/AcrR family transcriptional regulator [Celeribacter naphthalenivorans]|uniref:TetR/AcrR family transcriptional regulator n=1 Tax=Celeribacter naphthalenivorans TaxID=1614694 RepID=UPI001CFB606C|nr:TetR/AcrR family transcriptional regulator [Celeribacter naphthalenivorans]
MNDMPEQQKEDHRTRVGQERRQKTLDRLIEAAILVFAERGLNGTVIDHVVSRAGVSRGTFYNYFDTIEDALETARIALGREVVLLVKDSADLSQPPAERIAHGIHVFIEIARRNTLFLEFTARLGRRSFSFAAVLCETGPRFISDGIECGAFQDVPESLIFDMLEVGTIAILRRIMAGEAVDVEAFVAAMLRVLGLDFESSVAVAKQAVPQSLPDIPEDSLLARGNAAWLGSH